MSYVDVQPHGWIAGLLLYHPQGFYTDERDFVAGPPEAASRRGIG